MSYVGVAVLLLIAVGCTSFACFKIGYSLGWEERHRDMTLPRNIVDRMNKRLDDDKLHERHSGIWH